MSSLKINDDNREIIQIRYIDSIISRMDFMEIREMLRDCLHREINLYSNEDLLDEIRARGYDYLNDVFEKDCGRKVVLS